MTLEDIKKKETNVLTCKDVSKVLKCSEQTLHLQAQLRPELLGFPVVCIGNRVKIPKEPFIKFMEGRT